MCIIASGKRVPIEGFNRRSLDAKLSIAVTANFVNSATKEEAAVNQISGISKQYHQVNNHATISHCFIQPFSFQDFFKEMKEKTGIDLENIVYYRGETHYFVMTALRKSLIDKGVIKEDKDDRKALLHPSNVDREGLHAYVRQVRQTDSMSLAYNH